LAEAIRKGPYSVNCLLAGFEGDQPRLYWIDYLGSVIETSKAAHGYAEYLTSSVMDTLQTNDLTEEEGLKTIEKCLNSMRDRFVISQSSFTIKIVRKDGIRVVREAVKPEGAF
jgi:20S proteasome subunit beta 4